MSSSSDLVGRPDQTVRSLDLPTLCRTILAGLIPRRAEAASLSGPVLVLAGAGTGKTCPLTAALAWRIGARGTNPARTLAATFTNKAAKDLADRIRTILAVQRAPSWIGTLLGLGARQLRIEPEVATLRIAFDILNADDSTRLNKRTLKAMNVSFDDAQGRDTLKQLCNRIASVKDQLVTPDEAPDHVEGPDREGTAPPEARSTEKSWRLAARVYLEY